ncbi:MAG: hypothetical protein ACK42C_00165 [Aquificaceae bacterium]
MMQETGREINWLERIFSSEKASVEVVCGDRVINPFTTIELFFYADGEPVKRYETIFKCDTIENCGFCFTHDFSSVVLTYGREKKTIPTVYENVLLWNHIPIFDYQFYDKVLVKSGVVLLTKERRKLVRVYKELELEENQSLYRLVIDNNLQSPFYTENLVLDESLRL